MSNKNKISSSVYFRPLLFKTPDRIESARGTTRERDAAAERCVAVAGALLRRAAAKRGDALLVVGEEVGEGVGVMSLESSSSMMLDLVSVVAVVAIVASSPNCKPVDQQKCFKRNYYIHIRIIYIVYVFMICYTKI